jgi:hypothetical protein
MSLPSTRVYAGSPAGVVVQQNLPHGLRHAIPEGLDVLTSTGASDRVAKRAADGQNMWQHAMASAWDTADGMSRGHQMSLGRTRASNRAPIGPIQDEVFSGARRPAYRKLTNDFAVVLQVAGATRVRRVGLEPTTRGSRGCDVPSSLVPLDAASPAGAGQSAGRALKRPSGAHQSMAREHPPSTQTQHHHRLRVVCGRSKRVARFQNSRAANRRPTAPVLACRMPSDQRKPWFPSTTDNP